MIELRNKEELYLLSTVRIETNTGTGTGFFCQLANKNFDPLSKIYFLVTNKHVIKDANSMTLKMHKIDSSFEATKRKSVQAGLNSHSEVKIEENLNNLFFFHPNEIIDIAILNLNKSIFKQLIPLFIPIELDNLIPPLDSEDINIYSNVNFIGYPNGLYDKENLLPIIRKGSFATPYQTNFINELVFLIDASVFPGSSGSPVFLFERMDVPFDGKKMQLFRPKIYLLGIVSQVHVQDELFDLVNVKDIKAYGHQMIDIGVVYKSIEIRKLIKYYFISEFIIEAVRAANQSDILSDESISGFIKDENSMDDILAKFFNGIQKTL